MPKKIFNNILEAVGNTPIVKINRLNPNPQVNIYAKLEWYNPLGSVKERICLTMVEEAEKKGILTKDKIILESSSGNTGIGLALVGAVKGYKVAITMSEGVSVERRKILKALGAELILTSKEGGSDEAWEKADELYRKYPKKYCRLSQYRELANPWAHYKYTAGEIWKQLDGKVDVLIATLGTTGTLVGAGKRLKELNPKIKIISVEPQAGKHKQQGLRNLSSSRVPEIWDESIVDEKIVVKDEDAFRLTRELAKKEGLFGGISCGTAIYAAQMVAKRMKKGKLVVIFPDHGFKYLSTEVYDE